MKKRLMCVILVAAVIPFSTYAWFSNIVNVEDDYEKEFEAKLMYYGGGDGSIDDPFIISEPRHLYNLAWLQDLGFYDGENKKYFEVTEDIDMTVIGAIPPIGIDSHPFVSSFNGNGKIISNLTIGTTIGDFNYRPLDDVLDNHTSDTVTDVSVNGTIRTSYVGMFGTIETKDDATTNSLIEGVSNFILNNCEVAINKTGVKAGVIAGYVDGNLSKIGVANSNITLNGNSFDEEVVSKYTLVGDYDFNEETGQGDVEWINKPGQQGRSFGGSLNFKLLNQRLNYMQTRNFKEASEDSSKNSDKTQMTNQFNIYNTSVEASSSGTYTSRNSKEFNYLFDNSKDMYGSLIDSKYLYFYDGSYFPINVDLNEMNLNDNNDEYTATVNGTSTNRKINSKYSSYTYEKVHASNTGYFIGGKASSGAYGMVSRFSTFYYSGSENSGIYKSLGIAADTNSSYAFNKDNDVCFLSVDTDGNQFEINENDINILTNKKTLSELNYKRFTDVKSQLLESMDGQKFFPGVHFSRTINTSSLVKGMYDIPVLSSWDEANHTYTKTEKKDFVKNTLDFELNESGYITVVAATCYRKDNSQTLFDLYKVSRNGSSINSLTHVDKIEKDGETVFDFDKQKHLTEPSCLYYFEIPVEAGEYVISASSDVSSAATAYLLYLDIATSGESQSGTSNSTIYDIDFIKMGTAVTPFGEGYIMSNLLFEIKISGGNVVATVYFERNDDNIGPIDISYRVTGENVVVKPLGSDTSGAHAA